MQEEMAKSEIPSIVVHPGIGGCNSGGSICEGAMSERPRLSKQEEIDMEEDTLLAPSPITIHIEGEKDSIGDKVDDDDLVDETDQTLPTSSTVESFGGGSDSDSRPTERSGPRSHGHAKGVSRKQLGKQGSSQGSQDGSSPSLSRDSSTETYTDSTGIDLQQFIVDTLHKSQKDRAMLLKIEQDLFTLVKDNKCQVFKFTPMSSYNRMLVHRVAAFFGMEHNIDKPGTSVIVNKTKNTRLPDVRFSEYIRDELVPDEPKKLILKRDSASFEEGKESPERQSSMDSRRSKSFEEREEEYEKARARIFNQDEGYGESPYSLRSQEGTLNSSRRSSQEDLRPWTGEPHPWSSSDSDSSSRKANSFEMESSPVANNSSRCADASQNNMGNENSVRVAGSSSTGGGLLHPNQVPVSGGGTASSESRPSLIKASSFGGITLLTRDGSSTAGTGKGTLPARLIKAESLNETSSSGLPVSDQQAASSSPCERLSSQGVPSQEGEGQLSGVTTSSSPVPSASSQHNLSVSQEVFPVVYTLEPPATSLSSDKNMVQPSQACQWEAKQDNIVGTTPAAGPQSSGVSLNAGAALWPIASVDSLLPGSVLLNPTLATSPYFGAPDAMVYQAKALSPTQAYVVTPIHALRGPLLPPPPPATINGKPMVTNQGMVSPSPSNTTCQPQGNQSQLGSIPVSQYGTVIYIPCVASHVPPGQLVGQQAQTATSPSATLQLITPQQQQQQQQQQHQAVEHRSNQAVMPDLVSQLSALTLTPPNPPQPTPPPSASVTCEMTSYLVPAGHGDLVTKLQTTSATSPPSSLKGQCAPLTTQVPLYYVPQSPTGVFNGLRYVCPGGPPMILHSQLSSVAGHNSSAAPPACCIKSPDGVNPPENSMAQSPSPHVAAGHPQSVYPGYTFLGFPHQTLEGGSGPLQQVPTSGIATLPYSYTATPSPCSNGPSPSPAIPSASIASLPVYPYANSSGVILNSAIPNSSHKQTQQPQPQQQFFGQSSPVCVVGGGNATSYSQPQYRQVTPNVLQSVPTSGAAANTAPYLSYTIYSPQNTNYSSIPSSFLQVLRPNFPATVSNLRNTISHSSSSLLQPQVQSFQGVPVQFTTASALPNASMPNVAAASQLQRGKILLPTKQDVNLKEVLGASDMKFNRGVPRLHLSGPAAPSLCVPQAGPLYRQTLPLAPDVRLLGRPLHQTQQVNPTLLLAHQQHQQCPRFASHYLPHQIQQQQQQLSQQYSLGPGVPMSGISRGSRNMGGGSRKGRTRTPTHHRGVASADLGHSPLDLPGPGSPLVLDVDGIPQGLRRNELERYLDPLVANYGAKIQVLNASGDDCVLDTTCKHRVLAVFETEATAQSALLNIKTHKFQLRLSAPCKNTKS